jgi:hypothetical protein
MDSDYVTGASYILYNSAYGADGVKVMYQGLEHIFYTKEDGEEIRVPMHSIKPDNSSLEDNEDHWFIEEDTRPNSNMTNINVISTLPGSRRKRKSRKTKKVRKSRK